MTPILPAGTVLVVDDEPAILQICQAYLADGVTRVLTARDGPTALKILAETPVDVLLTDYSMPGMSGAELLELVRETSPQTVQLLFTGLGDCRIAEEATRRGELFRFLVKPFDRETLRQAVQDAFTARANARPRWKGCQGSALPAPAREAAQTRAALEAYARQACCSLAEKRAVAEAFELALRLLPGRKS